MYLYSHHPSGHLWLVGRSLTTWSLRLNYLTYMKNVVAKNKEDKRVGDIRGTLGDRICPIGRKNQEIAASDMDIKYPVWEYLQSRSGEDEIWLKDDIFDFVCIS